MRLIMGFLYSPCGCCTAQSGIGGSGNFNACFSAKGCSVNSLSPPMSVSSFTVEARILPGTGVLATCSTTSSGCCLSIPNVSGGSTAQFRTISAGYEDNYINYTISNNDLSTAPKQFNLQLSPSNIAVSVPGCNGYPLGGAVVTLSPPLGTAGSATTGSDGIAHVPVSGWLNANHCPITVTAAGWTGNSSDVGTMFQGNGAITCSTTITPGSPTNGYTCCINEPNCGNPYPPSLNGNIDGNTVALVNTSGTPSQYNGCFMARGSGWVPPTAFDPVTMYLEDPASNRYKCKIQYWSLQPINYAVGVTYDCGGSIAVQYYGFASGGVGTCSPAITLRSSAATGDPNHPTFLYSQTETYCSGNVATKTPTDATYVSYCSAFGCSDTSIGSVSCYPILATGVFTGTSIFHKWTVSE